MFSSKEYLQRKTGPYGIGRLSYLQSLVNEFQDSDDIGKIMLKHFIILSLDFAYTIKVLSVLWKYVALIIEIHCKICQAIYKDLR